jgi:NAD(P)-dependent dehydrogenase (short-subunit alcohol dehydrogenase family)
MTADEQETVLITGCSSGIGHATAEYFLEEGWTVYATSRDPADLGSLAEAGCETAALDVTDAEEVEAVRDRMVEEAGRIDCLVNNAGYGQYGPLEDVPADKLHDQFDVNVYGPHRLVRAVLPAMREQEAGTIINVSSVNGRIATPGTGAYAGSKFALEAMSDALRNEVDGFGVDVVLVEPGPVGTAFDDRAEEELDEGLGYTPAYEWLYDFYEDGSTFGGDSPLSVPPEAVAATIHDAAVVSDPADRYPVGREARLLLLGRFVPHRLRDALYRVIRRLV